MESAGLAFLTFVSAVVGTMTGFGMSTMMVPILTGFWPLPIVLLFVGVLHWLGDIWKMIFFKKEGVHWKLIYLFGIPGIIVSFLAAKLSFSLSKETLQRILGVFLVLFTVFVWLEPEWKMKASNDKAILGGALSGFLSGIFGVGGAIRSAFLAIFDLPKSVFLFTSGLIGILIDSSRLIEYYIGGTRLNNSLLTMLGICIPASLAGAYLAKGWVENISQKSFRKFIAAALFIVGIRYLVW